MESIKTNKEYKEVILRKIIDGEDDQKANKEGRENGHKKSRRNLWRITRI